MVAGSLPNCPAFVLTGVHLLGDVLVSAGQLGSEPATINVRKIE